MDIQFFTTLFIIMAFVYLMVGFISSKNIKSEDDFSFSSSGLSYFSLTLTLLATQIGGGAIIGSINESYERGFSGLFYNLGIFLGLIILAMGVGKKLCSFKVRTNAEIFEKIYGSRKLRSVASVISALSLFGLLVGQVVASKNLFNSFFDESMGTPIYFWIFWAVVLFYTMFGGFKAVVTTDIIQIFIIFLSLFIFIFSFETSPFSEKLSLVSWVQKKSNFSNLNYSSLFLMPIFFSLIEQDLAQRIFSAKNEKIMIKSVVTSALILLLFSFVPVYIGYLASLQKDLTILPGESVFMSLLLKSSTPFVTAIMAYGLFSAVVSTADSLISAIISNILWDFKVKTGSNKRRASFITFSVGFAAVLMGSFFDNILMVLVKSYQLSINTLFVPLIMSLMPFPRASSRVIALTMMVGGSSFLLMEFFSVEFFLSELVSVLLALGCFLILQLSFSRRRSED